MKMKNELRVRARSQACSSASRPSAARRLSASGASSQSPATRQTAASSSVQSGEDDDELNSRAVTPQT